MISVLFQCVFGDEKQTIVSLGGKVRLDDVSPSMMYVKNSHKSNLLPPKLELNRRRIAIREDTCLQ